MSVLVAYATRHGATRGIAERIAERLRASGLEVDDLPVRLVHRASDYDAFVVGSAAYMFHWLPEARKFVDRNRGVLSSRPLWLFSSGPLGPDQPDARGVEPRVAAEPKEFAELAGSLDARDRRVFFGAYDSLAKPSGFMERLTRILPATRNALPEGDFRDWAEIEAWADEIARALSPAGVASAGD